MATKQNPKPKPQPKPAPTIISSSGGNFDIGQFLKEVTGSPKIGGTDFTGVQLQVSDGVTSHVPTGTNGANEFYTAIQQLKITNPGAAAVLNAHFGFTDTYNSKQASAAWQSIKDAKYNLSSAVSPSLASTKAELKILTDNKAQATAAAITSATAGQQANAIDNIRMTLEGWNYTDAQKAFLNKIVTQLVTVNGDHIVNQNALLGVMRGEIPSGLGKATDAEIKADYNKAFPGLAEYNSQPGAVHMNETQYTAYTTSITNSATQFGAPMPTQEQVGKLLTGHVSAAEYSQRVTDIYAAVSNADQNTKNILENQYGIGPGQLMHYFMDPRNALQTMQRQVASAEIGDYASRVGLRGLTPEGTTQLADMAKLAATQGNQALGYGVNQIQNSLLNASRDVSLLANNPGGTAPTINTNTLIGSQLAGFAGTNQVAAQTEVARAEQAKAAPFEKGGGYVEGNKGVVGLGSART